MKNYFQKILFLLPDIIIRNKQIKCFTGGWLIMNMKKKRMKHYRSSIQKQEKRKNLRCGRITGALEIG